MTKRETKRRVDQRREEKERDDMVRCWFGSRVGSNRCGREFSNSCEQQLRGMMEFGL
jgi:hypothetical protein